MSMTSLSRLMFPPLGPRTPVCQLAQRHFRRHRLEKDSPNKLNPKVEFETPNIHHMGKNLFKCSIFSAAFCTATFTGVSIWQYERLRSERKDPLLEWAKSRWTSLEGWQNKEGEWRKMLNKWWNELYDGHKVFWPICFLNTVVFAGWQLTAMRTFMLRYFAFSPAARAVCLPMLLSTFSHYNLFHLAANMYVLHSFSAPVCNILGREQFLGLYLTSGILSSLAGAAFKIIIRSSGPSLGASGAIMGILGYFCSKNPDSKLGIVFIPQFHFSAEHGLYALLCLDTTGLIMRWTLFDHAAHLGGAITGIVYARWGKDLWSKNKPIVTRWHKLREGIETIKRDS